MSDQPDHIDCNKPLPGRKIIINGLIYLAPAMFELNPNPKQSSLILTTPSALSITDYTNRTLFNQKIRASGKVYFVPIAYLIVVPDQERDFARADYLAKQAEDLKAKHSTQKQNQTRSKNTEGDA